MAKRRVWSQLSAAYQTRLTRKGITPKAYESGVNLSEARGHAKTPEHPKDAVKNPVKYQDYLKSTKRLAKQVFDRKKRMFGGRFKWHETRARQYVFSGGPGIKIPGKDMLRAALAMSDDEFEAAMNVQFDDDWKFLWYH